MWSLRRKPRGLWGLVIKSEPVLHAGSQRDRRQGCAVGVLIPLGTGRRPDQITRRRLIGGACIEYQEASGGVRDSRSVGKDAEQEVG